LNLKIQLLYKVDAATISTILDFPHILNIVSIDFFELLYTSKIFHKEILVTKETIFHSE